MTSGVMLPLTTADLLAMTIVGSVLENMDMERLITGKLPHAYSTNRADEQKSDMKSHNESSRKANRCRVLRRLLSESLHRRIVRADQQGTSREVDASK